VPDSILKAVQGLRVNLCESAGFQLKGRVEAPGRLRESVGFRSKGCVEGSGAISENLQNFALEPNSENLLDFTEKAG